VVGIHSPEFPFERKRDSVAEQVREHGLAFPHLLDNDLAYWNALHNEYWPTLYLLDRCGRVRHKTIGEVHGDAESGQRLDTRIEALLAEKSDCP
jgi:hypothetical protein